MGRNQGSVGGLWGPFAVDQNDYYQRWRDWKMAQAPQRIEELVVEVDDPASLSGAERSELLARVRRANMALYTAKTIKVEKETIRKVGRCFDLENLDSNMLADDDGITPLHVAAGEANGRPRYIPYTNRAINWHTDGYYNTLDNQIYGLLLHCGCDAAEGGINQVLDHEIAYIHLRETNPAFIEAMNHPEAMIIPENVVEGEELRPDRAGPVFMCHPEAGSLHMRYTRRARNVIWRDDPVLKEAISCLEEFMDSDSPYIFKHKMTPGQGLVSNNVLHDRSGFADDADKGKVRMLYRARYFDRIGGTALNDVWTEKG